MKQQHDETIEQGAGGSCCGIGEGAACGDVGPLENGASGGRSYRIGGLDCAEEVAILTRVLAPEVGGQQNLVFDVINGRMTILEGAGEIDEARILRLIAGTGMDARPWRDETAASDRAAQLARQKRFTVISGIFWTAGILYHVSEGGFSGLAGLFVGHGETAMPWPEAGLFLAALLAGVWQIAPRAWASARHLSPDMNLLMIVAVTGAIGLGEYFEAATVAFLFALSLFLESWSVGRARNAVAALLDLAPPVARVIGDDGTEAEIPAARVAVGRRIVVRGGDRIPLDGEVIEGTSGVNQAPITGESAEIPKEPGDEVYAGTINGDGTLIVRTTKPASDTMLARIIHMVGEAHARRANVEQWVAKFARIYTPIVMALAIGLALVPPLLAGGGWAMWFYNALVLLVIACPCALVISTPVSIVAALASAARNGVLIKGGAYLEALAHVTALALDKTGTITEGAPELAGIHPLGDTSPDTLLTIAGALGRRSSHPLARAVLSRAERDGIEATAADTRIVPGRGVEGHVDGRAVWLGSERFAAEKGVDGTLPADLLERIENTGGTVVVVGAETGVLGILELRDRIRSEARNVIDHVHRLGVQRVVMLTGDNDRAATAVAAAVGIDEVRAEILPAEKVAAIEKLIAEHDRVAMVGDGVNDAPAMARAHLGIAMGAIGSDAAVETADIALMSDDLEKLPWLISHSRRTLAIIRQNVAFSLAVKALFFALAAFGMATMWEAIAADVGVSLLVVANALRLLRGIPGRGRRHPAGRGDGRETAVRAAGH